MARHAHAPSRLAARQRRFRGGFMDARSVACVMVGVVAVLATCAPRAAATQMTRCPHACGVPPADMPFCSITYSVCQTQDTWEQQALAANASYYDILSSDTGPVRDLDETCLANLKLLQCDKAFPACEIPSTAEIKRVCESQCTVVSGYCPSLSRELICAGPMSTEGDCYKLDYDGANVAMWLAGFVISVVFSFLAALGINLQKHSMHLDEVAGSDRPAMRQPMWVTGFVLILLGSILDFVAFGLAPQTFLAPLGALSLVWNIMLAPRFHGERVTRRNLFATVVIILGVVSTVIFSTHRTPKYNLAAIEDLFQTPVFIVYAIAISATLLGLWLLARYIERTGVDWGMRHVICYGGLGGIFGGQSVMLAKSVVELVKSALFEGGDAFAHFPTYVLVAGMAFTLLCQISFLNNGLRLFDSLVMVPTYQACWVLASVLGGEFYFQEYRDLNSVQVGMFIFGTATTVMGIAMLLSHPKAGDPDPWDKWLPPLERWCGCAGGRCAAPGWENDADADNVELMGVRGTKHKPIPTRPASGSADSRTALRRKRRRRRRRHRPQVRASTGSAGSDGLDDILDSDEGLSSGSDSDLTGGRGGASGSDYDLEGATQRGPGRDRVLAGVDDDEVLLTTPVSNNPVRRRSASGGAGAEVDVSVGDSDEGFMPLVGNGSGDEDERSGAAVLASTRV